MDNDCTFVFTRKEGGDIPLPVPQQKNTVREIDLPFEVDGYVVEGLLCSGGMGFVYKGYLKENPAIQIVIKIPKDLGSSGEQLFIQESRLLQGLSHPNIVSFLSSGVTTLQGRSYPYVVMRFVEGQSLKSILALCNALSEADIMKLLRDICCALQYLSNKQICHLDLKPGNILFDNVNKRWILVDFGAGKNASGGVAEGDSATTIFSNILNMTYASPEQKRGEIVDIRSDIYALGKIVWQCFIGRLPEVGTKYPQESGVVCSEDTDIWLRKMTMEDPSERYQRPRELLEALDFGAGKQEVICKKARETRKKVRLALFGLGAALILAIIWVWGNRNAENKMEEVFNNRTLTVSKREDKLTQLKNSYVVFGLRCYRERMKDLDKIRVLQKKMLDERYEKIVKASPKGSVNDLQGLVAECAFFENEERKERVPNEERLSRVAVQKERAEVELEVYGLKDFFAKLSLEGQKNIQDSLNKMYSKEKELKTIRGKDFCTEKIDGLQKKLLNIVSPILEQRIRTANLSDLRWVKGELVVFEKEKYLSESEIGLWKSRLDCACWVSCTNDIGGLLLSGESHGRFQQARERLDVYQKDRIVLSDLRTKEIADMSDSIDSAEWGAAWLDVERKCKSFVEDRDNKEFFQQVATRLVHFKNNYSRGYEKKHDEIRRIIGLVAERFGTDFTMREDGSGDSEEQYLEYSRILMDFHDGFYQRFKDENDDVERRYKNVQNGIIGYLYRSAWKNLSKFAQQSYSFKELEDVSAISDYFSKIKKIAGRLDVEQGNAKCQTWCEVYWNLQRPPKPLLFSDEKRCFFKVEISRISVTLSSADYDCLKPLYGDVKFSVILSVYGKEFLPLVLGKNERRFSMDPADLVFYQNCQQDAEPLRIVLKSNARNRLNPLKLKAKDPMRWRADLFKEPGKEERKYDSGTTIELEWKSL